MDRYYVGEDDEEEDDDDHCDDVHDVGDDADDECGPEICGFRDSKKSVFFFALMPNVARLILCSLGFG